MVRERMLEKSLDLHWIDLKLSIPHSKQSGLAILGAMLIEIDVFEVLNHWLFDGRRFLLEGDFLNNVEHIK